jgi:hypothetical protein
MVTKITEWVCATTLLLVVSWRPFASYQTPLDFLVCALSALGALALFCSRREIETHYLVDKRLSATSRVTVKVRATRA